uniref:Ig-like domain-containing protein n=1 Tax=Maylandia zebra TaxID=106582 RepID=A0A3P9B2B4_9CICH
LKYRCFSNCWGPRDAHITLLEWSRPELSSQGYVFFFQDQRSYENYQHESFKGRVQLRDSSMKDGDVTVILRNVSISDTGTYDCQITTSSTRNGERVVKEFQHSINLTVTESGESAEAQLTAEALHHVYSTSVYERVLWISEVCHFIPAQMSLWRQFYQSLFGEGEFCFCVTGNLKTLQKILNVFPLV